MVVNKILNSGEQPIRPTRIEYPESRRLQRIRFLARMLDTCITLPGGFRIGFDPIVGLIPGIGDFLGGAFSFYLVYEAARLGIPTGVLLRMCGNVVVELLVGEIPLLGDIFDAVWKANARNVRLVELHHHPAQPERSGNTMVCGLVLIFLLILCLMLAIALGVLWLLISWFKAI